MFRRIGSKVPFYAGGFLMIMALLIDSSALFYMATAMLATIGACRLQAYASVRGLKIERIAPPAVHVGQTTTVSMVIWSERKIKRPLITVLDLLPARLKNSPRTPSLPIAPAFDQPVQTRYSFRPMRRGRYRWNEVNIRGTDTLGLQSMDKVYITEPAELIVYPTPIPINVDIRPSGGIGVSESESGQFRGAGIEPRGIREYQPGDPQRYVHWTSSARSGRLMVKEFESGSGLTAWFFLQRRSSTDVGDNQLSSFEVMCGHARYLAEQFMRMGAAVNFPSIEESDPAPDFQDRLKEIDEVLTDINADLKLEPSDEIESVRNKLRYGGTAYVQLIRQDPVLPALIQSLPDVRFVVLAYNAADYVERVPKDFESANAIDYSRQLEEAGAKVVIVPGARLENNEAS